MTVVEHQGHDGVVSTKSLHTEASETLLQTLERYQIDIQYHCRDGFCGACRTTLIDGCIDYITDPLAFIDDDECLPCCAKPNGPVTLKLD
ncbi:2Fe-2S ferredoxin-like protein [Alteromonas sp. SM 2104]|nr:2Fe-2S ferredoxin-like protein [Alteromonas oceanisediminis]